MVEEEVDVKHVSKGKKQKSVVTKESTAKESPTKKTRLGFDA